MEKINVALAQSEDNAAAIRELEKKLMRRTACRLVVGIPSTGHTSFGEVTSDGTVGVIVQFNSTAAPRLYFGDDDVGYSKTPIVAVLPAGTNELYLPIRVTSSYALIFGA